MFGHGASATPNLRVPRFRAQISPSTLLTGGELTSFGCRPVALSR